MIGFATYLDLPLMVVDDEEPIRRAISRYLEKMGYDVVTAADANEARAALQGRPIALALCDIDMPGESGLSLVQHIVNDHPDTRGDDGGRASTTPVSRRSPSTTAPTAT